MSSVTEWEIIDALTDGDVSRFGFTYREAWEWLQDPQAGHLAITAEKFPPGPYVLRQGAERNR